MRNGKWYLVYTKTNMEYDEIAGCCGGVGNGGAFVDIKKDVSIALETTTKEARETEAKEKWKKIRDNAEALWKKDPKSCGRNYTHRGFLDSEASNPRIVYKVRRRSKAEMEVLMREDEWPLS